MHKKCFATIANNQGTNNPETTDVCFMVKATPFTFEGGRFIFLFMQDITAQEDWASLEHTFFHDINNTITALLGTSELAARKNTSNDLVKRVYQLSLRLAKEIEIQNILVRAEFDDYRLALQETSVAKILSELKVFFKDNPSAADKALIYPESLPARAIYTDHMLVLRMLTNLVKNACEASESGDEVRIGFEEEEEASVFSVWNKKFIPDQVSQRIFQKHFSTKGGQGRGFGTYAVKLFGERYLKGSVSFSTSEKTGTLFQFRLPSSELA